VPPAHELRTRALSVPSYAALYICQIIRHNTYKPHLQWIKINFV